LDWGRKNLNREDGAKVGIYRLTFGCVDYQFSGHDAHHQTGFSYQVYRTEIGHGNATFAILIGEDVPMERLLLVKTIVGRGDYAD